MKYLKYLEYEMDPSTAHSREDATNILFYRLSNFVTHIECPALFIINVSLQVNNTLALLVARIYISAHEVNIF